MKYSIIIPIYNAEKTLHRCLDSVLRDVRDAEIILVNDGSKDQSGKICEEYKEKYSNIVYIDKPNGGVSAARNDGLDIACGKYVLYVDSDDYVAGDFYQILDSVTENDDCDIVYFSHIVDFGKSKKAKMLKDCSCGSVDNSAKKIGEGIYRKWINPPWGKLYKKEILEKFNIRFFQEVSIGEDRLFNITYALHIKSCKTDSRVLYYVNVENENSLSRKPREDILAQSRLIRQELDKALSELDVRQKPNAILVKAITEALDFGRIRSVYAEARRLRKRGISLGKRLEALDSLCKRINDQKYKIPKNLYCFLIALPIRCRLTVFLDIIARVLNR